MTGKWLATAYKLYHATLEEHFDREVKKRGCKRLNWDASYKISKCLALHHGKPIYKALTGTNDVGEIRVQFHVVTDGHDQFEAPIEALLATLDAYGQEHPELFTTDNPKKDVSFFVNAIPSLKAKQVGMIVSLSQHLYHCLTLSASLSHSLSASLFSLHLSTGPARPPRLC
jgi:hypothetical protein